MRSHLLRHRLLAIVAIFAIFAMGSSVMAQDRTPGPTSPGTTLNTGTDHQTKIRREDGLIFGESSAFFTVLSVTITIPGGHGQDSIVATYHGQTACFSGSLGDQCNARIVINGVETAPSGGFILDTDEDDSNDPLYEGHTLQGSACKGPGTYTVSLQTRTTDVDATDLPLFDLDQSSFEVVRRHTCSTTSS